jgi:hypothetical protein
MMKVFVVSRPGGLLWCAVCWVDCGTGYPYAGVAEAFEFAVDVGSSRGVDGIVIPAALAWSRRLRMAAESPV